MFGAESAYTPERYSMLLQFWETPRHVRKHRERRIGTATFG